MSSLVVLADGIPMGRLTCDPRGRLSFVYEESWRESADAYPLSLSMPLAASRHPHAVIEPFLWGLLPDNANILDRWAKRFQVSARNVFALISKVGEDCAGAVQFVQPERLAELDPAAIPQIEWLNEKEIETRLALLRADHAAWRLQADTGQFSLAGAQPKTALFHHAGRWGVPSGRTPTTHIFKPPSDEFDGHAENEYFCLKLARALGLPAAGAEVRWFGKEPSIVVERYDRIHAGGQLHRVHQEDMCQALGLPPTLKYQNEGGPGPAQIVGLLRTHSSARDEDIDTFVDALALNWLMAGTDAHAKNYSLLVAGGGRVRLAPLYDVASALLYPALDQKALKLAMKLGSHYRLRDISFHDWARFAKEAGLDAERILGRVGALAAAIDEAVEAVVADAHKAGLAHPIIPPLAQAISKRAADCRRVLALRPGDIRAK